MHEGHELSKNIILDFFFSDVENTNVYHSKYYAPSITCITYKQILQTTSVPAENIYDITIPLAPHYYHCQYHHSRHHQNTKYCTGIYLYCQSFKIHTYLHCHQTS